MAKPTTDFGRARDVLAHIHGVLSEQNRSETGKWRKRLTIEQWDRTVFMMLRDDIMQGVENRWFKGHVLWKQYVWTKLQNGPFWFIGQWIQKEQELGRYLSPNEIHDLLKGFVSNRFSLNPRVLPSPVAIDYESIIDGRYMSWFGYIYQSESLTELSSIEYIKRLLHFIRHSVMEDPTHVSRKHHLKSLQSNVFDHSDATTRKYDRLIQGKYIDVHLINEILETITTRSYVDYSWETWSEQMKMDALGALYHYTPLISPEGYERIRTIADRSIMTIHEKLNAFLALSLLIAFYHSKILFEYKSGGSDRGQMN